MAYVQVPKDLSRVKTKVLFNLTRRQVLCFALAGIVGIPFYLLTKKALGTTVSAMAMILVVLPFFLLAMYEKDGRPLEKVIYDIIQSRRVYNITELMQEDTHKLSNCRIYSELAKYYTKIGKYEDALRVCDSAIACGYINDGTKTGMYGRKERIERWIKKSTFLRKIEEVEQ